MEVNSPKRFERKPNLEINTKLSKDGRYWIIKRSETWILPRKYLEVIAQNGNQNVESTALTVQHKEPVAPIPEAQPKTSKKGKRDVDGNG